MKIAVLSRNPRLYSTRRLVEAGQQRGHEMVVIDHEDFQALSLTGTCCGHEKQYRPAGSIARALVIHDTGSMI